MLVVVVVVDVVFVASSVGCHDGWKGVVVDAVVDGVVDVSIVADVAVVVVGGVGVVVGVVGRDGVLNVDWGRVDHDWGCVVAVVVVDD